MRKSVVAPLILGIAGVAVLIGLGKWQVDRLAWKEGVLADIGTRIRAEPVGLPARVTQEDRYLPVEIEGRIGERALRVLVSQKQAGAGYRVISALETDGRRVLLDRGFIKVSADIPAPPAGAVTVTGNLHWPDERLGSTPANDVAGNIWFARDIAQMAEVLETEPVLVVARALSVPEEGVTPLPVTTGGIPNDHLSYAITWFSLAAIWAAMTGVFIWRMRQAERGTT